MSDTPEHTPSDTTLPPGQWLIEPVGDALFFGLRAGKLLASGRSAHQTWEVWDTPALGRLYRLNGHIMAAEYDEFMCHEALVHAPGLAHPAPRSALILGGGDGGSARELLRYPSMQRVVVAELDEEVVALSRAHLPFIHNGAFDDPRMEIVYGDARDYVGQNAPEKFDLIIFDLTDPDSGASPLFQPEFFSACIRRLTPMGALSLHLGSPLTQANQIWNLRGALKRLFPAVTLFYPDIPSYGGTWAMACASFALQPAALDTALLSQRLAHLQGEALRSIDNSNYAALLSPPPWAAL